MCKELDLKEIYTTGIRLMGSKTYLFAGQQPMEVRPWCSSVAKEKNGMKEMASSSPMNKGGGCGREQEGGEGRMQRQQPNVTTDV